MNISFEKLSINHIPYVYEIRFSVKENKLLPHHIQYLHRDQLIDDINQGGGWICRCDQEYSGFCFGVFTPEPIVGGLFVKPEYQSRGIGRNLLELVTGWFIEKGVKQISLTTDIGSRAETFYKGNGWSFIGIDEFGQAEFVKYC